jgi:hypothetical protein
VLDYRAPEWTASFDEAIAAYEAALEAYLAADWRDDDKAAKLMAERCARYRLARRRPGTASRPERVSVILSVAISSPEVAKFASGHGHEVLRTPLPCHSERSEESHCQK